ncbi:hypothetical protein [Streptomyces sp. NPDC049040]|uniref:hypothetical protein n=1 Tax=Streptomyces sp. NPDC049040 TaxID=3365593 RepID=UPI0037242B61
MTPDRPARPFPYPSPTGGRAPARRRRRLTACAVALAAVAFCAAPTATAAAPPAARTLPLSWDAGQAHSGGIPANFVGLSIEWSLIERYMSPTARPAFVRLLRNLGTGVLRIGGSSQDVTPFDATAQNTDAVITPQDLTWIRETLDAANAGTPRGAKPAWGVVLGTAMSPPSATRPFVSPDYVRNFLTQGVAPVFTGAAARYVAGIELGNEPDLSYGSNLDRYLADLTAYTDPAVVGRFPIIAPSTSEDILPWESVAGQTVPTRWFWDWQQILDTAAARVRENAGAFGPYASDHFYPLARTCTGKPYRCASTGALLSDEHMASLDHQVWTHATEAAAHGLGYRLEETSTAANRGADGVSNVAASATYALDLMFHTACPQPPDQPSANTGCTTGAIGLNFHNAEVRAFYAPEEGNGYYNAVDYDPTPAIGAPTAAPLYYAMLLFGHFAQGAKDLRPVAVPAGAAGAAGTGLKAWQVGGAQGERRLFLINKSDQPTTVTLPVPAGSARLDRMTPYDPDGTGRTLDAPQVRVDGRAVEADGRWPGFRPATYRVRGHRLTTTVGAGEAVVVTLAGGN